VKVTLTVNGRTADMEVAGWQCGACTVDIDGKAVRSCVYPVSSVGKGKVTTLEGLGSTEHPHPLQQAFIHEQAAQCGYCINGMIMQAKDELIDRRLRSVPFLPDKVLAALKGAA
jgi:nicotinate dehydrogenase subunit A